MLHNIKQSLVFAFGLALLTACSSSSVDLQEEVAVFQGDAITSEDVLYQYSLDNEGIEAFLKEEIIITEAKSHGIEVTDEDIHNYQSSSFESYDESETGFFEEQAKTLDISPEEYYEEWADRFIERNIYLQLYIQQMFDNPETEAETEEWPDEVDSHIEELFEEYKETEELEIFY